MGGLSSDAKHLYTKAAAWGAAGGAVLICVPALVLRLFDSEWAFFELAAYVAAIAAPFVAIVSYRLRPETAARRLLTPCIVALSAALVAGTAIWLDELHIYGIGGRDWAILAGTLSAELVVFGVPLSFVLGLYARKREVKIYHRDAEAPPSAGH